MGASASTMGQPKSVASGRYRVNSTSSVNSTNSVKTASTTKKNIVSIPIKSNVSMAGNVSTSRHDKLYADDLYMNSRRPMSNYYRSEPGAIMYNQSEPDQTNASIKTKNNNMRYITAVLLCAINFTSAFVYIITSG